jgi:hypothetical protein
MTKCQHSLSFSFCGKERKKRSRVSVMKNTPLSIYFGECFIQKCLVYYTAQQFFKDHILRRDIGNLLKSLLGKWVPGITSTFVLSRFVCSGPS